MEYFDEGYCDSIIAAEKSAYKQRNFAFQSTINVDMPEMKKP